MDKNLIFYSARLFEAWRYTVNHRQLLLRSNKTEDLSTRIEVLFKDVDFMALPPAMRGLRVTKCDMATEGLLAALPEISSSKPWYRIEADRLVGYVAAGAVLINEDELSYNEASPLISSSTI